MFSRVRERFGTAGLVVSIIALVAVLAGGAYAASGGLTGKQKKEVKKIAKKFAGKDGATGPQGPKGDPGAAGAAGKDGSDGAAGKGVVVGNAGVACAAGGASVEVEGSPSTKKVICNGVSGFTETLPSGETLKGTWSVIGDESEPFFIPNSFGIPMASAPKFIYVLASGESGWELAPDGTLGLLEEEDDVDAVCPGDVAAPEAEPGYICVYSASEAESEIKVGGGLTSAAAKPTAFGFSIPILVTKPEGVGYGTWAATAA